VLGIVPGGTDAEHRATTGDRVERRDLLREHRRVAIRHTGHERPQPDATRLAGERRKHEPALEHRLIFAADAADLVEVVHDRHEVEAGGLGCLGLFDDAVEEMLGCCVGVGVGGEVKTEPDAHEAMGALRELRRERLRLSAMTTTRTETQRHRPNARERPSSRRAGAAVLR
jgi:hypothetical protein